MSSSSLTKARKSKEVPHDLSVPYARTERQREQSEQIIHGLFSKMAKDVARQLRGQDIRKAAGDDQETKLDGHLVVNLTALDDLATELQPVYQDAFDIAGNAALAVVGAAGRGGIVNLVNNDALDYAQDRGAELVGKKWVDGVLVTNPNAQWAIDDTTRDMLNNVISIALDEGWGIGKLADTIEGMPQDEESMTAFSGYRAKMIARTETIDAHNAGILSGFKAADSVGVHVQKEWWPDADACPICIENSEAGPIDLDDVFPSGDDAPTAHPNCECTLIPYVVDAEGEETDDDTGDAQDAVEAEES